MQQFLIDSKVGSGKPAVEKLGQKSGSASVHLAGCDRRRILRESSRSRNNVKVHWGDPVDSVTLEELGLNTPEYPLYKDQFEGPTTQHWT
jgi:hypothetical protein